MSDDRYILDGKSFVDTKTNQCLNFGIKDLARVTITLNNMDMWLNQAEERIAKLEQENESYQKLINDICNKHRVGSLKELDEMYQATTESLYASRKYLEELKSEKCGLEKALELAAEELDDAKDMLRECNKNEFASLLNTSVDYFKARGKEVENDRK